MHRLSAAAALDGVFIGHADSDVPSRSERAREGALVAPRGGLGRKTSRAIVLFGMLTGALLVVVGARWSLAQHAPQPIRRHLVPLDFDPTNPRGPYLGQRPPGMVPKVFAPGFISTAADEYAICFSPDGNEIYVSRYTPGISNTIWVTRQVSGAWSRPKYAEFTRGQYASEAFITRDNARMYFISDKPLYASDFQIWTMTRTATAWSTPTRLGEPFSGNVKMGPSVATNGNLYFTEFANNESRFLLARNENGSFAAPVPLHTTVNAFPLMGHAFVAPDESWLVFDATADAPQSDGAVLFVSFRSPGGDWLPPVRLNLANRTANEYNPAISPDGRYLFFTRRSGSHDDIWWVDARVVFDLRPATHEPEAAPTKRNP